MDQTQDDKMSSRQKNIMIFLIVFIVVIVPLGYVTKVIPYFFTAVNCGGLPVEATSSPAGNAYTLPGDKTYGISMFSSYQFCTESDAKQAGYQRSLLVD